MTPREQAQSPALYNRVAPRWWSDDVRWIRTLKNLVPARLSWMNTQVSWNGKQVLDLGCAGGFMAEAIAQEGACVTGIDPAENAIEAARDHAAKEGLDIAYHVGQGEALPFADASFDIVVCVDVLEHVQNLPKVLSEIQRVLKPGGVFLFDTINRNPLAHFLTVIAAERILNILPRGTHDSSLFIKPFEMTSHLTQHGLNPHPFVGLGPKGLNRRGDIVFGILPFTTILYMGKATKTNRL